MRKREKWGKEKNEEEEKLEKEKYKDEMKEVDE